jgi:hypothetical protein
MKTICRKHNRKMTHTAVPLSQSAERMRRHRQRRRNGLRCLTIELYETEVDALIQRGLLKAEMRNDSFAIIEALYEHLKHTLASCCDA